MLRHLCKLLLWFILNYKVCFGTIARNAEVELAWFLNRIEISAMFRCVCILERKLGMRRKRRSQKINGLEADMRSSERLWLN